MKEKLLFIMLLVISTSGCADQNDEQPSGEAGHIQYFGFAVTDSGEDKLDEVDDFVNLVDMCLHDFSNIKLRVVENTQNQNLVFIHLDGIFLDRLPDSTSPTTVRYVLQKNYQQLFDLWLSNNTDLPIDRIAAFTVADEPAWNNMNMADLAIVTNLVKSKFPTVPIMLIESYAAITELRITDDINWIGFDRYGTLDPKNDPDFLKNIEEIKAVKTNISQKLVIIMESQWVSLYADAGFDQSVLIPMAYSYYDYAKGNEEVIALISYLLPSDFDESGQKGFLDLDAEVKKVFEMIGKEIIGE